MNHLFQHIQGHLYGAFRPRLLPTGGAAFSPLSLFASGEQGVWYDPSDFSTMFQDSTGTTPVTAVEQPVGLVLDKSKGLVLGPELLTVPLTGGSGGAWGVNSAGVTRNGESSLQASLYSADAYVFATSKTYLITLTVADFAGDPFFIRLGGGGVVGPFTANGTHSYRVNGGGSFNLSFAPWAGAPGEATITNISVRELPGNHAIQATAAARPVVSARRNLLTYTEDLSNAAWGKTGAVATTATRLTEDSSTGAHFLLQGGGVLLSQTATVRCAAGTRRYLSIWSGYAGTAYITYDLQTGLVTEQGAGVVSASCTASPLGGYNCSVSFSAAGALRIAMSNSGTAGWNVTYTGDGSSYLDIYSQQHELGSTATRYQRVTTATDYDTVGFPRYIANDGIDDLLATTFPDLGTDVTIARAVPFVGASILTAQTIGAGVRNDATDHAGLVIIDRALTAGETAALTAYLNAKAGV